MGFLIAFDRKIFLTNYINILERKINDITEEKLSMADRIATLNSEINDISDSDSPAVKQLRSEKARIEVLEKKLDVELQKYQAQLQAANTEIQSANQALQKGIEDSFSWSLGR